MPPRWRFATHDNGEKVRDALENMVIAIREKVTLTNRMLQQLRENGGQNRNSNGNGAINGNASSLNSQFYGLFEFKKM